MDYFARKDTGMMALGGFSYTGTKELLLTCEASYESQSFWHQTNEIYVLWTLFFSETSASFYGKDEVYLCRIVRTRKSWIYIVRLPSCLSCWNPTLRCSKQVNDWDERWTSMLAFVAVSLSQYSLFNLTMKLSNFTELKWFFNTVPAHSSGSNISKALPHGSQCITFCTSSSSRRYISRVGKLFSVLHSLWVFKVCMLQVLHGWVDWCHIDLLYCEVWDARLCHEGWA